MNNKFKYQTLSLIAAILAAAFLQGCSTPRMEQQKVPRIVVPESASASPGWQYFWSLAPTALNPHSGSSAILLGNACAEEASAIINQRIRITDFKEKGQECLNLYNAFASAHSACATANTFQRYADMCSQMSQLWRNDYIGNLRDEANIITALGGTIPPNSQTIDWPVNGFGKRKICPSGTSASPHKMRRTYVFISGAGSHAHDIFIYLVSKSGALVKRGQKTISGKIAKLLYLPKNQLLVGFSQNISDEHDANIFIFKVSDDGSLTEVPGSPFGNTGMEYYAYTSKDENYLYTLNFGEQISSFSIANPESIEPLGSKIFMRAGTSAPEAVNRTATHLYIADRAIELVDLSAQDGSPPEWTSSAQHGAMQNLDIPDLGYFDQPDIKWIALDTSDTHLYALINKFLVVYRIAPQTGILSPLQKILLKDNKPSLYNMPVLFDKKSGVIYYNDQAYKIDACSGLITGSSGSEPIYSPIFAFDQDHGTAYSLDSIGHDITEYKIKPKDASLHEFMQFELRGTDLVAATLEH